MSLCELDPLAELRERGREGKVEGGDGKWGGENWSKEGRGKGKNGKG